MLYERELNIIEDAVMKAVPNTDGPLAGVPDMLRYSLESGGKRVRPLLCLMFCEACGGKPENALPFAAAVEFIHTYSLIHDDLPCMDNDDMRRGKPSSHVRFGEANALLAGDALLTHAFYLLAEAKKHASVPDEACLKAVFELSRLAGVNGMVGGQYIDLASEGATCSGDLLLTMDLLKTGALIEAACVLGCIAGGAQEAQIEAARVFAQNLGVAFQIRDDVLEFDSDEENSDERNQKSTYVSVFGREEAGRLAAAFTEKAISALACFRDRADVLRSFAEDLLNRKK